MSKNVMVVDVTGFNKINGGRNNPSYSDPLVNKQRLACVTLFKLCIANGVSAAEAARDCGYTLTTLRNWCRFFDGPTTR